MSISNSHAESRGLALVLGGRSWVGFRLTRALGALGWEVVGTTSSSVSVAVDGGFGGDAQSFVKSSGPESVGRLIIEHQPAVVVNLLIGIATDDFKTHQVAARESAKVGALYVYASSALALDGYVDEPLLESLSPRSISAYGMFKQACENDTAELSDLQSLIVRFSSIHGWCPWKDTRTVIALKRLGAGETICVDRGVVQNRCSDSVLASTLASLVDRRASGVAHLGTADHSEEFEFMRKLATAFGYDPRQIVSGPVCSRNLAVVPKLGQHPGGPVYESDTLELLLGNRDLAEYRSTLAGDLATQRPGG